MSQRINKELEQAILALKKENSRENIDRLMKTMEDCNFYIPATLPPDMDPKLMKQMADTAGKTLPIPKGVAMRPAILENKEGKKFLPIFTSHEQVERGKRQYPLIMGLPFQSCMDLVKKESELCGMVLNAFDHNITLNIERSQTGEPQKREVKLTKEQLDVVLRQQLEASVLPSAFFERKDELMEEIREKEGEVFLDLYRELYPEGAACPYNKEDFEVMMLNIRDDLSIMRLTMPEKASAPGTCSMVLVSWNPEKEKLRYFGLVRGNAGQGIRVMEAMEDGKKQDLGEAPDEGSELQFLIQVNEENPE